MGQNAEFDLFQKEFLHGSAPNTLDGFYSGELEILIPNNLKEALGALLVQFFLPWRGKYFYNGRLKGDNILPNTLSWLFKWKFGKGKLHKNGRESFHAFPFKTYKSLGLIDKKKVLRLDYNLRANPLPIRNVVDELVRVERNSYLGKANIIDGKKIRTVAFFRLKRN